MNRTLFFTIFITPLLLLSSCSKQKEQAQTGSAQPLLEVSTITVEKKPVPLWMRYTGRTKASNRQDIVSRVSGVLQERYVEDGQEVKKGQKLFKIQQDEYIAALKAAQAKLQEDKAALKLAIANVKRYAPLVKEGLAPRATLESYQAQEAKLKAAIQGDLAKIKQAKLNLDYTIIRAPISGKISARRVDVGNMIDASSALVLTTIVSIDPIYAYFSPSQNDVFMFTKLSHSKKPYAFVELQTPFGSKRFEGHVDFSDNVVDPLTSTITMRATIKNKKHELMPGSFVYVNIFLTDKISFLMIPPYVIMNDQLGKYVYVVDQNGSVKRKDIQTGYTTKYYTAVTKGLQDKEKLIVSSLLKIKPGMKVKSVDVTQKEGIDAILKRHNLLPKKAE